MSTFCWSRNSIVEDPSSFCGSCCVQDQKEQSANQQLSLVVGVLVAMFVKNDSGNDAPFVSTLIGHFHN